MVLLFVCFLNHADMIKRKQCSCQMSNGAVNIAVAGLNLDIYLFILKGQCILMSICKCPWQARKKTMNKKIHIMRQCRTI